MNSAIFSACGRYRYRLDRDVFPTREDMPVYAFFGVNGSTATGVLDDHTVRKWNGFCWRWGVRRYIVGNAFGFTTSQVTALAGVPDPVGPRNDHHLAQIIAEADVLIPCWGSRVKVPQQLRYRFDMVKRMLEASGKPMRVFGLTQGGDPLHPLMLGYNTVLQEWTP